MSEAESLSRAGAEFLGFTLTPGHWLSGGDEARVLRVEGRGDAWVLHASAPWRTPAELAWVHRLTRHVHQRVPEAVAPVQRNGTAVFQWRSRQVAVFRCVEGGPLDRDDDRLREQAARLLAEVHSSVSDWSGGERPPPAAGAPVPPDPPEQLVDVDLDAWWVETAPGLVRSPTHGDYYRANLLCRDGALVGIIDWHEACAQPTLLELAGATFELCKNESNGLDVGRARRFVADYRAANGPVPDAEIELLLPAMRVWVRSDALTSLAWGSHPEDAYVQGQIDAFAALADTRIL